MKNVKYLILKHEGKFRSDECQKAMLELRNSPKKDGVSPSQRLFGRPLRSNLPMHWKSYDEKWQRMFKEADQRLSKVKVTKKMNFDKKAKDLPVLRKGDRVLVQDIQSQKWNTQATVVDVKLPRRYQLRFPSGRTMWRNRHLIQESPDNSEELSLEREMAWSGNAAHQLTLAG